MERKNIDPKSLWDTKGFGFSHGVLAEGKKTLFISGQSGIDKDGKVMENGFEAQCTMAFDSIDVVLKEVGASFHNVVKVNAYLTDVKNLIAYASIAAKYFKGERPAQTLIEVKGLALPGMLVEVEAVAII